MEMCDVAVLNILPPAEQEKLYFSYFYFYHVDHKVFYFTPSPAECNKLN